MTIRILTGHSQGGGSTIAHINLTNALNERGIETILYGPHDWHLDKCKSGKLHEVDAKDEDSIIAHYLQCERGSLKGKFIYSCHETNLTPLSRMDLSTYDKVHFVSESQRLWHGISKESVVIPNIVDSLKSNPKTVHNVAGVIGSIDAHKNTAYSIKRAVDAGYNKVLLYGFISDKNHYNLGVKSWVDKGIAIHMGHSDDKQVMYDSVNAVFHSSLRETFNYVKMECDATGTEYYGLESSESGAESWSKDKIVDKWIEVLGL